MAKKKTSYKKRFHHKFFIRRSYRKEILYVYLFIFQFSLTQAPLHPHQYHIS